MNTCNHHSYCVVLTTLGSEEEARSLVRHLVKSKLVACGTIIENAVSIYEWQGQLEETPEVLVLLKTRLDHWDELQAAVHDLHPYEVPELLALPVGQGQAAYLAWLAEQTNRESK